jgi:hypothetical protein
MIFSSKVFQTLLYFKFIGQIGLRVQNFIFIQKKNSSQTNINVISSVLYNKKLPH